MISGIAIDHFVIHVSDWERSNAFYKNVLGAEIVPRGNGFAYRFGNVQINCHGPGQAGYPVARLPVMPGNSDFCVNWPGGVEGARAHLAAHDVSIELGPVDRVGAKGAGTSIYFRDPDGSLLEFICYENAT
jgi:catechol 2,3-dioxygenase-like lactoylglutathione lyase family enzyme